MLLTPWLSVSFGFVIASSLALSTPRAVLTFPAAPGSRCQVLKCAAGIAGPGRSAAAGRAASPSRARTGGAMHSASTPPPPPPPPSRVADPVTARLQYGLLPPSHGQIVAMIVITGRRPIGAWTLRFAVPGEWIDGVIGANWRRAGPDSGIAFGVPYPWSKTRPNDLIRIVLLGTGEPRWPDLCIFDGARCSFGPIRQPRQRAVR